MSIKNILLVHKRSAYELFGKKHIAESVRSDKVLRKEKKYFLESHKIHYATLAYVEKVLKEKKITYKKVSRDQGVAYRQFDLIITVGGDGTFLRAATNIGRQYILGVNSAPAFSVGRFCTVTRKNFDKVLEKVLKGHFSVSPLHRLELTFSPSKRKYLALNDCLVTHQIPADMARYIIKIGKKEEKQRSSGIWISTAVGSSGAMKSAGGKLLKETDKKFEYKPRELYQTRTGHYRLTGGILSSRSEMTVLSLMPKGAVYIDGSRQNVPFPYGSRLRIKISPNPVLRIRV